MRNEFLPFSPPDLGEDEIEEVVDTLRSGWITTGPKVKRFEELFADFIGAPAALATSSATEAMQVGLAAMGIGAGDEVITTPMTFCSTVHVIEQAGATPVLADVEEDTLNISPRQVEAVLTSSTRAMLPVHLYGHPCAMDELGEIATEAGLLVLEDAAHAIPATFNSKMIGTIGDLTSFSFYATKNMTTGEGGMLTGSADLVEKARVWSQHGMSNCAINRYQTGNLWQYEVVLPGFKCNMTDIQAAIGMHQLARLPSFHQRRTSIVSRYNIAFAGIDAVETPTERPGAVSAWHIYAIRLNLDMLTIDRDVFIRELTARNIGTSVHFIPVHIHPYYRQKYGYKPEQYPVAYTNYLRTISLPLNTSMTDDDVEDVISAVSDVVQRHLR